MWKADVVNRRWSKRRRWLCLAGILTLTLGVMARTVRIPNRAIHDVTLYPGGGGYDCISPDYTRFLVGAQQPFRHQNGDPPTWVAFQILELPEGIQNFELQPVRGSILRSGQTVWDRVNGYETGVFVGGGFRVAVGKSRYHNQMECLLP